MHPLTIGSASTGPIQLSPKGTTGLYVNGAGQVGINTTSIGGSSQLGVFSSSGVTNPQLRIQSTNTSVNILGFDGGAGGDAFIQIDPILKQVLMMQ